MVDARRSTEVHLIWWVAISRNRSTHFDLTNPSGVQEPPTTLSQLHQGSFSEDHYRE